MMCMVSFSLLNKSLSPTLRLAKWWGNDEETYEVIDDETYQVIIFKIHSIQEAFLEHQNLA